MMESIENAMQHQQRALPAENALRSIFTPDAPSPIPQSHPNFRLSLLLKRGMLYSKAHAKQQLKVCHGMDYCQIHGERMQHLLIHMVF
jgi:hypothetical protein